MSTQERPGNSGWLALALVMATALLALLALLGKLSIGTSLGLMAVTFGSFLLGMGALFSDESADESGVQHRNP